MPEQHYTTGEVAKMVDHAPRTVTKWYDKGLLKGYKIPLSQDRRITRSSVVQFLRDNKMPVPEELCDQFHRVLLVCVSKRTLQGLTAALTKPTGFELHDAQNGFQAGRIAYTLRVDTVVIDFSMGRADAMAISSDMREADKPPRLVVGILGDDDAAKGLHGFDLLVHQGDAVAEIVGRAKAEAKKHRQE